MKLRDFDVLNFSGGLVRNKSDYEMNKNEVVDSLNFEFDNRGRAKTRRGYYKWGTSVSPATDFISAFTGQVNLGASTPSNIFFIFTKATNSVCYRLVSPSLTVAFNDGMTTLTCSNTADFLGATAAVEVNGDDLTYTAKPSGTTLTITESTILANASYPIGTAVNQYLAGVDTGVNGSDGIYCATLNGVIVIGGRVGNVTTTAGATFTAVTDDDQPAGLFHTNYRDRIYVIGSGATDAADQRNGQTNRVSYSDAGDATSWTLTNFFDVEDQRGEMGTGLRVKRDRLLIFKRNSTFYYDEVQLKLANNSVGAYNHWVTQEIDGVLFTFCPRGVFAGNGFTMKKISEPVESILKNFRPKLNSNYRVVDNTYSWQYDGKYYLYIGDITDPYTKSDVVLCYDTQTNSWTIEDTVADPVFFLSSQGFKGGGDVTVSYYNGMEGVFALTSNRCYRLYENRNSDNSGRTVGTDVAADLISDSTGTEISAVLEPPMYDMGNPSWWKNFGYIRVLIEQGDFNVSYRIDDGTKISDYKSLGQFKTTNTRKLFNQQGYRIGFKITSNNKDCIGIFNGLIIEDIEAERK